MTPQEDMPAKSDKAPYLVVGSGVSAILTAMHAVERGYHVVVLADKSDPRLNNLSHAANERFSMGSSWDGGPTRMASPKEGEPYLGGTLMYPDMIKKFEKTVAEGGWLDRPFEQLTENERSWIERRRIVDANPDYIDKLKEFYGEANVQGMALWRELEVQHPECFGDDVFFNNGIFRGYDDMATTIEAVSYYSGQGLAGKISFAGDIPDDYPYINADSFAGVMEIDGLSLNLQGFMKKALTYLESRGVDIHFSSPVTAINRNELGAVESLSYEVMGREYTISAKYISLHLGAYDHMGLMKGTEAENTIMGVAGLWMEMPKPPEMQRSMKAHYAERDGQPLIDLNLIINGDRLIVGSGYIFNGEDPYVVTDASRQATYQAMIGALDQIFKDFDESSVTVLHDKLCTRSFTWNDLPNLHRIPTVKGGQLVFTGGENTGTTSMGPAMAKVIVARAVEAVPANELGLNRLMKRHNELRGLSNTLEKRASIPSPVPPGYSRVANRPHISNP